MFSCTLQTVTELAVERLGLSATAAHSYFYKLINAPSRRDRPHNIRITTLLFTIDVHGFF